MFGLDQLVDQLSTAMGKHAADPSLYDDRRDRPATEAAQDLINQLGPGPPGRSGGPRRSS